jgi:hypothetical protein
MSVTLYEPALRILLESQEGPVGRYVERLAARIEIEAQQNVKDYFGGAPSLQGRVDQDIDFIMEGSTATIGIRDGGNKSRRIARYQAEGRFNWLSRAVERVRAGN